MGSVVVKANMKVSDLDEVFPVDDSDLMNGEYTNIVMSTLQGRVHLQPLIRQVLR